MTWVILAERVGVDLAARCPAVSRETVLSEHPGGLRDVVKSIGICSMA
jgi:hypothetical protein